MGDYDVCSMYYMRNFSYSYVSASTFLDYIAQNLTKTTCSEIEERTEDQSDCDLWWRLRYGRITASTIWSARSKITPSIFEKIMQPNTYETYWMQRGKELELPIRKILAKSIKRYIWRSGLVLNARYPALAASPDGVGEDFVVEIKCPTNWSTYKMFFNNDKIPKRYLWQLRLQMLLAEKDLGYYCIADPDFEQNKKITYIEVDQDDEEMGSLITSAMESWKTDIFPHLDKYAPVSSASSNDDSSSDDYY